MGKPARPNTLRARRHSGAGAGTTAAVDAEGARRTSPIDAEGSGRDSPVDAEGAGPRGPPPSRTQSRVSLRWVTRCGLAAASPRRATLFFS